MTAKLYLQSYCFLCRWVAPGLIRYLKKKGVALTVFKVHKDGFARQVGGSLIERAWVPAVPALYLVEENTALIGAGILRYLKNKMEVNNG